MITPAFPYTCLFLCTLYLYVVGRLLELATAPCGLLLLGVITR